MKEEDKREHIIYYTLSQYDKKDQYCYFSTMFWEYELLVFIFGRIWKPQCLKKDQSFQVLGLGLLIVGALMKANVKIIKEELKPALNSVTVSSYKLGDLTDNLSIVFIAIGVFIFLVAGLGLFGACCQNRCMLVTASTKTVT